ncbi:swr complex subunit [Geranomyces michiganensis]|nr:swr complex subunit [Geranomyces michiganensis]
MNGDIRDIMQLGPAGDTPGAAGATTSSIRKAAKASSDKPKDKKSDGMARELLSLVGGAPPLVLVKKKYKARPNFSKQTKAAEWVWRKFLNPARTDKLELQHWVKATDGDDYYFAKFNKPLEIIRYDGAEYEATVKPLKYPGSESWTRAETDYLYSLLLQYDLRWPVVADRYDWEGQTRSVDDLKERYYAISHALLTARGSPAAEITPYVFNKAHELERKKNLEILYARTKEQIDEEEKLFYELKRREAKEERMAKEREGVWHLLRENEHKGVAVARELAVLNSATGGLLSGAHAAAGGHAVVDKNLEKLKKRKASSSSRRSLSEDGGSVGPATSGANAETPPSSRKKSRVKDEMIATPEPEADPSPMMRKMGAGCFARSQKIPGPKPANLARVTEMMHELGIQHTAKPHMSTAAVCDKFVELQTNCQILLEIKKASDRLDFELDKLRARARSVERDGGAPDTPVPAARKRGSGATPATGSQKKART